MFPRTHWDGGQLAVLLGAHARALQAAGGVESGAARGTQACQNQDNSRVALSKRNSGVTGTQNGATVH